MGYETKIVIVQKHDRLPCFDTKGYAKKIAEFNLCKMDYEGPYMQILDKFRTTDCYYYADDGNTEILEDRYGEELKEINIKPLIRILRKEDQSYPIIPAIISMLGGISVYMKDYKNIVALHFGY